MYRLCKLLRVCWLRLRDGWLRAENGWLDVLLLRSLEMAGLWLRVSDYKMVADRGAASKHRKSWKKLFQHSPLVKWVSLESVSFWCTAGHGLVWHCQAMGVNSGFCNNERWMVIGSNTRLLERWMPFCYSLFTTLIASLIWTVIAEKTLAFNLNPWT
jgi:hypothetical protein